MTSDAWLKLSINFACLPRETGKARALEIDSRRVKANLSTDEEEKLLNEYMHKDILHRNRKQCGMIHSRIKWLHDPTKINRVGCDKVSQRSNCVEIFRKSGAVVAGRKERARWFCEVGCPKVKLEQEGEAVSVLLSHLFRFYFGRNKMLKGKHS